ncbi:hypothetical protein V5799_026840 [Amblyomma americanum]|uniref:Fanconi-associated nuclease n=1 Tax=Amblyomma americanum TaxID=6943 RepID=A0AAQ4DHE9_AMBAM
MFYEFLDADEKCQKLLARLLQRKHMWRRTSKIGYPDIAHDISPVLLALRDKGYIEDATSLKDLGIVLRLLSPYELKTLAQVFKLKTSGQGKGSLADSLLDHCSKQQPVLFGSRKTSLQQLVLKRYEASRILETELIQATAEKKWDKAKQLFYDIEKLAKSTDALERQERDQLLAPFLRHFSMCGVYTRCRCLGVDVLQRLKEHRHAIKVLQDLLDQKLYCQSRRGHWWDRLALNLEVHLGKPNEALKVLHEALDDPSISPAARHALVTRANRLAVKMPKGVSPTLESLLKLEKFDTLPQVNPRLPV